MVNQGIGYLMSFLPKVLQWLLTKTKDELIDPALDKMEQLGRDARDQAAKLLESIGLGGLVGLASQLMDKLSELGVTGRDLVKAVVALTLVYVIQRRFNA